MVARADPPPVTASERRPRSRARRLSGAGAFEAVFRNGTRREGRYVQIVIAPAALGVGRVGFVIGRRALPRAVDRNRLKRLLREFLRTAEARVSEVDLIIRLTRPIAPPAVPEAAAEAARLVTQATEPALR